MHGLPTIGTIGFGWFEVSGRRRVPSPPAMTTAFIAHLPTRLERRSRRRATDARAPTPIQKSQSGQSVPVVRDHHEARATRRAPRSRALPRKLTAKLVAARHDELVPADEQRVTREDDASAAHGSRSSMPEQDHRGVDHQPVGERVGDLAELRLDVPAAREPAVDLVGDAGDAEDDRRRPSCARRPRRASSTTKTGISASRRIVSAFGSCASGAGRAAHAQG